MKNLLAILVAGFALVACSKNDDSANANASAVEASAPVAQSEEVSSPAAPASVEASAPAAASAAY
jgi:uncharacterized protein YcfL